MRTIAFFTPTSDANQKVERWKVTQTRSHGCGKNQVSNSGLCGSRICVSFTLPRCLPHKANTVISQIPYSPLRINIFQTMGGTTANTWDQIQLHHNHLLWPWGNYLFSQVSIFSYVNNNAYCEELLRNLIGIWQLLNTLSSKQRKLLWNSFFYINLDSSWAK